MFIARWEPEEAAYLCPTNLLDVPVLLEPAPSESELFLGNTTPRSRETSTKCDVVAGEREPSDTEEE
jgi:hypothetical protein